MSLMENFSHQQHKDCHCGFSRRLAHLRAKAGKRLGILGATFMIAHFLFHVVECLVMPAILMGFGSQITQDDALATGQAVVTQNAGSGVRYDNIVNWSFYDAWEILDLSRSSSLLLDNL